MRYCERYSNWGGRKTVGLLSNVNPLIKKDSRFVNRPVIFAIDWLGKYHIGYMRFYTVTPRELP